MHRGVFPNDLTHEWYTVGVLLCMFVEALTGFLLGAGIAVGSNTRSRRRRAFAFVLGGALIGLGVEWILARGLHWTFVDWRRLLPNSHRAMLMQAIGASGALFFDAWKPLTGKNSSRSEISGVEVSP